VNRLLVSLLLISPILHSEGKCGIDVSMSLFSHIAISDRAEFNGQSLGFGIRISDPDRTNNVGRVAFEKGFHTSGYSNSIPNIHNYYSLSCDYIWHHSESLFMGTGVRVIKFDVDAPPPSPHGTVSAIKFGTNNSALPQFIAGFRFANHISIELDTSLIQNNLQLRYSF